MSGYGGAQGSGQPRARARFTGSVSECEYRSILTVRSVQVLWIATLRMSDETAGPSRVGAFRVKGPHRGGLLRVDPHTSDRA